MKKNLAFLAAAGVAALACAQTVTLSLNSPQNGQTINAGSTVSWSISFTTSTGNNQGLALLVTDLTQDETNPAFLNIPPASGVPAPMTNFSRPAGISNPGEGGPTGYVGVQRGTAGQRNLVQVGGAQNTFGVAGSGVAENPNVTGGIGQGGVVTLASGSFAAPGTNGAYTFRLANAVANVVQQINAPPNFSPVVEAAVTLGAGSISFNVTGGGTPCPGDVDGDNDVDLQDLATLLANFGSSGGTFPGDLDDDGDVDLQDLATLLAAFGQPCP